MREIFETKSTAEDLFFFKGREFPTLLATYARAQMTGVIRDYNIDGDAKDFVCFSMLADARAKANPVLSFEKYKDKGSKAQFKLHSRASGSLKTYNGSFITLMRQIDTEVKKLQSAADAKVVRANFGGSRP